MPSLQPLDPGALPCYLFGDECQALGHSYMVITWMSEVTPKSQDSWFSRHLITLIPVEHYYIHDKQNLTLMAVMEVIANCFNDLARHGAQGIHLELLGIKGDWKWHKQVACLDRYYGTNFCCHLCSCTKNLTMPFTDITESAAWKATVGDPLNPPWPIDRPPTVCKLMNFSASFLLPDLLHVWYLGVGRDVVGSVMLLLIRTPGFFAGAQQKARFHDATKRFKAWVRAAGKPALPKGWKFDRAKISMKGGEWAHFKDKGARTAMALQWLHHELNINDCGNAAMRSLLWAAEYSIGVMVKADVFLTDQESSQIAKVGQFFLIQYLKLHHEGSDSRYKVFHLRPKWHLLTHVFMTVGTCKNPAIGVCWLDEDFLKKIMAVTKKCHKLSACENTIRRYLLGLDNKFREVLLDLKRRVLFVEFLQIVGIAIMYVQADLFGSLLFLHCMQACCRRKWPIELFDFGDRFVRSRRKNLHGC